MTVNELRTYLKDFPDDWKVNVVIDNVSSYPMQDGVYPILEINSIGKNSEYYKTGAEGYCIRGPQVWLEI